MACAGSAGGSQPPHGHPFRIPGHCEDDPIPENEYEDLIPPPPSQKKKQGERGPAKGVTVQALKRKLGGLIPLIWDPRFPKVQKTLGRYAKDFESETGKVVRSHVPCHIPTWKKVDNRYKQLIWEELRSSFEPLEDVHYDAVMKSAGTLFRKWKARLRRGVDEHNENELPGPCPRPRDVFSQEDWEVFLRHLNSAAFKKRSDQNKQNRSGSKYVGRQGRTPMAVVRWEKLRSGNVTLNEDPMGQDPIHVWAMKHKNADGSFINNEAEAAYRRLEEWRNMIAPDRALTFQDEEAIFQGALGTRRDYLIGLGPSQSSSMSHSSQSSQSTASTSSNKLQTDVKGLKKNQSKIEKKNKKRDSLLQFLLENLKTQQPNIQIPDFGSSSDDDEDDSEDEDEEDVDLDDDQ